MSTFTYLIFGLTQEGLIDRDIGDEVIRHNQSWAKGWSLQQCWSKRTHIAEKVLNWTLWCNTDLLWISHGPQVDKIASVPVHCTCSPINFSTLLPLISREIQIPSSFKPVDHSRFTLVISHEKAHFCSRPILLDKASLHRRVFFKQNRFNTIFTITAQWTWGQNCP